jgi:hypothetical protein
MYIKFDIHTSLHVLKFDVCTIQSTFIEYWSMYIKVYEGPIELHGDFGESVQQD